MDQRALAGLDDVVEGFHRPLDRRLRVEAVDLVQVGVVGAQPSQGRVDLFHNRLAGQAELLGGCFSTNATFALRGHPADYQTWAQTGNNWWSFDDHNARLQTQRCARTR